MWSLGEDRHVLGDYAWYMESEETAGNQSACEVGTRVANPWGLHDMHGNVWEWCSDWFEFAYYLESPRENPQGPDTGLVRILRGGSWVVSDIGTTTTRWFDAPFKGTSEYGFRCASSF